MINQYALKMITYKEKQDNEHMEAALWRLLELCDLTIDDTRNKMKLRELCRFKELLSDWFCHTDIYNVNPESLLNYSLDFAMLARKNL